MRAFVSLDLSDAIIAPLTRIQAMVPVGRKVSAEAMHLTLAFLGDQPETILHELHGELEGLSAPLAVTVCGVGSFGGDAPRLVYADVTSDAALVDLRRQVRKAARRCGVDLGHERFHPHITLSRISGRLPLPDLGRLDAFLSDQAGFALPPERCPSFSLVHSTLGPKGARYEPLATYPLI